MNQLATITSKNQLTLPAALFRKAGFRIGQKVIVTEENGSLNIIPAERLIEELGGILKPIKKWKGKSNEDIIEQSKMEYFRKLPR